MVSQQFTCCICLSRDQSVKKLSTKARAPTERPERQEVINKGQSAYRRTRASRSYQQKARSAKMERTTNDRHDGNHTRIGRSYTMVVPMNISSHGEVGDLTVEVDNRQGKGRMRPLIRTTTGSKKQSTKQHTTRRLRHLMHDKH